MCFCIAGRHHLGRPSRLSRWESWCDTEVRRFDCAVAVAMSFLFVSDCAVLAQHCLIGSVSHALSGTWLMKPVTSSSIRSCPKTVSTVLIKACSKKLSIAWSNVVSNTGCLTCLCCAAVRVNETDTFADEEGLNDEYFDFEDISGMALIAGSAHPCCSGSELTFWPAVCCCRDLVQLWFIPPA